MEVMGILDMNTVANAYKRFTSRKKGCRRY
jgi:hypothetical protein